MSSYIILNKSVEKDIVERIPSYDQELFCDGTED